MPTSTLRRTFARLRLFIHVILHGCRIVSVESLECEKCRYESICKEGYFRSQK
jgi:hypothetical protein